MQNLTLTIKKDTYTVLAIVPVDADKFPNTAKTRLATIYMQKGNKGHIYETSIAVSGGLRHNFVQNLGAWSADDIAKIQALSIEL